VSAATWTAGEIRVRSLDEHDYRLAGWINGHFTLDARPPHRRLSYLQCGWVLTHRRTGYAVLAVVGDFTTAALVAADVASWGDWDFEERERVRQFCGKLAPLFARFPEIIVTPDDFPAVPWLLVPCEKLQRFLAPAGLETTASEGSR
jgi:hypothetical protein